jgi:hypothetical protein
MLAHWWRTGVTELRHAALRSAFVRAAARYVPELQCQPTCEPAFAGVRAQALGRDGKLVDDFVFSSTPSGRCTSATRPLPPPPPRWRSPATSPTRPSARSGSGAERLMKPLAPVARARRYPAPILCRP